MTKREALRRHMMFDAIQSLGFSQDEAETLRRISLTLHSWSERCCNEDIRTGFYRGSEFIDCTNPAECRKHRSTCKTYTFGQGNHGGYRIPNRETGALRRLDAIMGSHPGISYYYQTDPRGAALYLLRPDRLAETRERCESRGERFDVGSYYSSIGIAVY